MPKRTLRIDTGASRLAVRTHAKGMLARLAHDLEIVATTLDVRVDDDGGAWTAEIKVPVPSLRVDGALRGDRVDPTVLSPGDRAEIERKLREEVLVGGSEVIVRASGSAHERGEATVSFGSRSMRVPVSHQTTEREGHIEVKGRCEVSLRELGVAEVKGPLGAFRVGDSIEVLYTLVFASEG